MALVYTVQWADVYDDGGCVDATPSPLPAQRVWWISVAARVFPSLATTSKAKRERKAGRLTLNGDAAASTNRLVVVGDRIAYEPLDAAIAGQAEAPCPQEAAVGQKRCLSQQQWCEICCRQGLRVVFDSDAFAVIAKPVGVHVKGRGWRTVENALPALLRACPASHPDAALPIPHALHRLDYRVGGLLLVAKTRAAEVLLSRQFENHRVRKRYRAILVGRLDPSELPCDRISLAPAHEFSQLISNHVAVATAPVCYINTPIDGKVSCTALVVRSVSRSARYEWLTTVDLWPLSGRWHQLRIHMAGLGHPIVGDDLHHEPTQLAAGLPADATVVRGLGLFLHAVGLSFEDQCGNRRSFEIDEPHKFSRFRHFCELNRQKQLQHHPT